MKNWKESHLYIHPSNLMIIRWDVDNREGIVIFPSFDYHMKSGFSSIESAKKYVNDFLKEKNMFLKSMI